MKAYKIILTLCIAISLFTLASCGGNDAAMNNGSDTGVSRSYNDTYDENGNAGNSNGMVENDVYANDGFADDNFYDDGGMMIDDGIMNSDMNYDANYNTGDVLGNSNLNY